MNNAQPDPTLTLLRDALRGTDYEGRVYIVGGYVRDKLLGRPKTGRLEDIDLVLEDDALALARALHRRGASRIKPVTFESFGTAMVKVAPPGAPEADWVQVELVTARKETYRQGSRKPVVVPGTLQTDAERRDFTVNTFLENLHTGEIRDPLGRARTDLDAGILRTPLDPVVTFTDDPLRMLRACRFAAKLGFEVAPETYAALSENAFRCTPEHGIAFERVKEELNKTLLAPGAARGLEMMRETTLLARFAPELAALHGVTQNRFHRYDVWTHTLIALSNLPEDAGLLIRLAVLFHDIGKPATRSEDVATGDVHFYGHEDVGAEITKAVLSRLRYSNDEIETVTKLVALHMRYGAYDAEQWTDAAVRRLIRTVGPLRGDLFTLARADISACNTDDFPTADLDGLQARMEQIEATAHVTQATSPLSGQEIMERLALKPGPLVGKVKDALTDAVVAGDLGPDDKEGAERMARALYQRLTAVS